MTPTYRLHYAPDNASMAIRLALDELALPYETVLVDRAQHAQRSPAYLALNPHGRIPVLETPDGALFETGAILLWLANRHGALAPHPDSPARGDFLKWFFFVSNTLHAHLLMLFFAKRFVGSDQAAIAGLQAHVQELINADLETLETLAQQDPRWFGADDPSVLDLYVAMCLRWPVLYPPDLPAWFDLNRFPGLQKMAANLETRPSVANLSKAEGLGAKPFTKPAPARPPEGSAL